MKYGIYKNLDKESKKEVRKEYYNTVKGRDMQHRFTKIIIEGIICLVFGIFSLLLVIFGVYKWYWIFLSIAAILAGLFFIIGQGVLRIQQYCIYLNSKKK